MRLSVRPLQRPESWMLALLFAIGAFLIGRQTVPLESTVIKSQAARLVEEACQPCLESEVQDFTSLEKIEELDQAICPRTAEEREIWFSVRRGGRVRLTGTAIARNVKESPGLKLEDGATVVARRNTIGDDPFAWEPQLHGHRVTVEGCIRRIWYPTNEQRRAFHARLNRRRQQLQNILVAAPAGYVYEISVASWKLAE